MRRILALALVVSVVCLGMPMGALAAYGGQTQSNGQIGGSARNPDQTPLASHTVRLRNVSNGALVPGQTTTTSAMGDYLFTGLNPGQYVVEVLDASGNLIGASTPITLTAGMMTISGVAITATAAGAAAAAASAGGLGAFFTSTAGVVILAGAGAGITYAAVQSGKKESPSK